jgi:tRNA pseudouridine55 synthase
MTSHDAVAVCRRALGERRVGHAGTLDPDATGVLLVGVGFVTRVLRFLTALPKTYTGEVVFGVETSTLDAAGAVTARHDMAGLELGAVREAAATLTGPILQVPPMVSAVRVGGRRLHELAREGQEVEREPRAVTVHRFTVEEASEPLVHPITVTCSSGTYVRTLAADLGHLLGGGAHLRNLRRRAVGSFTDSDARPLDRLELLAPPVAMRDYAQIVIDAPTAARVRHGTVVERFPGSGPWALVTTDGDLLAVYEAQGDRAKPAVVLVSG